jgi:hypothetical protein
MSHKTLLTFEVSEDRSEIDIRVNRAGLEDLIYYLQRLMKSRSPLPRHDHLMTESWGATNSWRINKASTRS